MENAVTNIDKVLLPQERYTYDLFLSVIINDVQQNKQLVGEGIDSSKHQEGVHREGFSRFLTVTGAIGIDRVKMDKIWEVVAPLTVENSNYTVLTKEGFYIAMHLVALLQQEICDINSISLETAIAFPAHDLPRFTQNPFGCFVSKKSALVSKSLQQNDKTEEHVEENVTVNWQINISAEEREKYRRLFLNMEGKKSDAKRGIEFVGRDQIGLFFKRSGLPMIDIENVWRLCKKMCGGNERDDYINLEEFTIAMKVITDRIENRGVIPVIAPAPIVRPQKNKERRNGAAKENVKSEEKVLTEKNPVHQFLEMLRLEYLWPKFEEQKIDSMERLEMLTEQDLKEELGLVLGERRSIVEELKKKKSV